VRRATLLLACAAALASALPAAAAFAPVDHGRLPRVRPGTIRLQPPDARVREIAELSLPPLAEHGPRTLLAADGRRKLAVHSSASRAYMARLASAQTRAVTELRRAIPQARIEERFRILLDAVTVDLPESDLPELLGQREFTHVYPSLRYRLALDTSPGVIGADTIHEDLGADGQGMKIAIVDDGIDQTNPFFKPSGFSYPPGFPKGDKAATTPKVIVARVFPGPNSGKAGRLPVDPNSSFHGTHVAGIAAGDAGTTAPAGADHPRVTGLSGVAPKAWLGNYRVFTVPTPIGNVADTPEIVKAFEAAVADGMDVINFSGGGPQIDPANDALIKAVDNIAAAGVVPVIAAGNDRDDLGDGTVGSPGTAPAAISVAAVSNAHVFAPGLDVVAPGAPSSLQGIPFLAADYGTAPPIWGSRDQTLVDVGALTGTDGKPVDRHLCGPAGNRASHEGTLPAHSLDGAIALAERGLCPFVTKAAQARAAGAVGLILSDNRQGEANQIPLQLSLPAGMVSNLDGDHLRTFADQSSGRTKFRVGDEPLELMTGRSGVITSFSASGPTDFGHALKPDIAAPGGQILSATLPNTSASRFAVFDGTSMATPHVSGAAALLLELHPSWTPAQVKSALVSTAAPAWADTARTHEAPAPLEGGGLVSLPAAADPRLFTTPTSLSFGDVRAGDAPVATTVLVQLDDAGGGAGMWTVSVEPQAVTDGASLDAPGPVLIPPAGSVDLAVTVHASADAEQGEDYGFVVLRQAGVARRIPYLFLVSRPGLATAPVLPLKRRVSGDTRKGTSRVSAYAFPAAPFGNPPDEPPMVEEGAETVYSLKIPKRVVNAGVSLVSSPPRVRIDPFFLGARDENSVQGYAGTPVDVNALTYDYLSPISAAGVSMPAPGRYYVAVDSGRDRFDGRNLGGRYVLRSWVNDVTPPSVHVLTTRVSSGRPTIAIRTTDTQSGVDPASLTIGYEGVLVGASAFDPVSGIATFELPSDVPTLKPGLLRLRAVSSDFEEAKNVDTPGTAILPNTRTARARIRVVHGPAVDWLQPSATVCVRGNERLLLAASAPAGVRSVRILLDGHTLASARKRDDRTWTALWRVGSTEIGRHVLTAVAHDRTGHTASARVDVRRCAR